MTAKKKYDNIYLTSNEYNLTDAKVLYYTSISSTSKTTAHYSVRLIKNANYGINTPFEASNQSINSWSI